MFVYKLYNETKENRKHITTCTRLSIFSINMRTFGNYLVYIICALETILAACSGYETNKFINDMISLHNTTRALHSADGLDWDLQMSDEAMKVLREEYLGVAPSVENPINNELTYLLFSTGDEEDFSANKVFLFWYNFGREGYDYTQEPVENNEDSFTQIVWRSTKKFGLAVVHKDDEQFVVASYFPPGHVKGKYMENVKAPKIEVQFLAH